MTGEHHRPAPVAQPAHQERHRRVVEVVRRLVEQQHIGSCEQQRCERDTAALPTRDLADRAIERQIADAQPVEQLVAPGVEHPEIRGFCGFQRGGVAGICGCRPAAQRDRRILQLGLDGAHRSERALDQLGHGRLRRQLDLLGEQCRALGPVDDAGVGFFDPGQQTQQRRLAGAILAEQAEALPGRDDEREVGQHDAVAVRVRDAVGAQHRERCRSQGEGPVLVSRAPRRALPRTRGGQDLQLHEERG